MNTTISFTFAQLITSILAICAGITCIAAAANWIAKAVRLVRGPDIKQDKRLEDLEKRVDKHDQFFDKDNQRIESIEEGNRVTQQALLALLAHGIDGNAVEEMQAAKADLQQYLIKR